MEKENELGELYFVRKFSDCLYKNKKLMLGNMDFSKDFIGCDRGDKYPVLKKSGDIKEKIKNGRYFFVSKNGSVTRLLGHFSPFSVYEVTLDSLCGECGFEFAHGDDSAAVTLYYNGGEAFVCLRAGEQVKKEKLRLPLEFPLKFSVQPRSSRFDVFVDDSGFPQLICTFDVPEFAEASDEKFFLSATAGVVFGGSVFVKNACWYLDSGLSQADIRAVKYENGDAIVENGKMFFTASVRLREGGFQGVFSWVPGTCCFELTGALFFDTGDGVWSSDVATSLVFDRKTGKWLLWVCSFSHGHILGRAEFEGEPLRGKNVIDIKLVDKLEPDDDDTAFGGKKGDEDPDLIFDEKSGKWLLAVCRVSNENGRYRYFFFESDDPLDGFECIGSGVPGSETGGSFVRYNGELYFVCGNSFEVHSDYRIYKFGDFSNPAKLKCDYPDGGFRGWGTVVPLRCGSRQKIYWLTFDRHNATDFNWSYGNIYCYEAVKP